MDPPPTSTSSSSTRTTTFTTTSTSTAGIIIKEVEEEERRRRRQQQKTNNNNASSSSHYYYRRGKGNNNRRIIFIGLMLLLSGFMMILLDQRMIKGKGKGNGGGPVNNCDTGFGPLSSFQQQEQEQHLVSNNNNITSTTTIQQKQQEFNDLNNNKYKQLLENFEKELAKKELQISELKREASLHQQQQQKQQQETTTATATTIKLVVEEGDETKHQQPNKKRWAIMMFGGARTYVFARDSFITNVIGQVPDDSEIMDIFTYTFFHPSNNNNNNNNNNTTDDSNTANDDDCIIDTMSLHMLQVDSTKFKIDTNLIKYKTHYGTTKDIMLRQRLEHLQMIEDYSTTKSITYDYVLLTRPDLFYPIPFNFTLLEKELDERKLQQQQQNSSSNSSSSLEPTFFSPECCSYMDGYCDRLGAATYSDFNKIIKSTKYFYNDPKNNNNNIIIYERAMKEIVNYANITSFDISPPQSYGFLTLRLESIRRKCLLIVDQNNGYSAASSLRYHPSNNGQRPTDTKCYNKIYSLNQDDFVIHGIDFNNDNNNNNTNHAASCRLLLDEQSSNCNGIK